MNRDIKMFKKNVDLEVYKDELSFLEKRKNKAKNKMFKIYNTKINKKFDVLNGINSIFDWNTGAVYFEDYEWQRIKNNKLKDLFNTINNNSYIYSLQTNNGIILRGSDIYYYFFCYAKQNQKTSYKEVKKWFDNCTLFFEKGKMILKKYKIQNNTDARLLLGFVDNLRNLILLMTNCKIVINYKNENILYVKSEDSDINKCFNIIELYQEIMNSLLFDLTSNNNIVDSILELLKKTENLFFKIMNIMLKINDSNLYETGINRLREIDHYLENYVACEYAIKEALKHDNKGEVNLISILYGGLELPFIVKNSCFIKNKFNICLLLQNNGNYIEKQKKEITNYKLKIVGNIDTKKKTLIIDDNLMSGVTMQLALDELKYNKFSNIKGVLAVRHPCMNRVPQLAHFNNYLNLELVDRYIYGLLTETQLTKIKDNTNYSGLFVNELNLYSIQMESFLKALYINNSFIKGSETDIFMGFSVGKIDLIDKK